MWERSYVQAYLLLRLAMQAVYLPRAPLNPTDFLVKRARLLEIAVERVYERICLKSP